MDRRTLMRSAASGAVSACFLGGMTDNALKAHAASLPLRPRTGDFVETPDGTRLCFTDWGTGAGRLRSRLGAAFADVGLSDRRAR